MEVTREDKLAKLNAQKIEKEELAKRNEELGIELNDLKEELAK